RGAHEVSESTKLGYRCQEAPRAEPGAAKSYERPRQDAQQYPKSQYGRGFAEVAWRNMTFGTSKAIRLRETGLVVWIFGQDVQSAFAQAEVVPTRDQTGCWRRSISFRHQGNESGL